MIAAVTPQMRLLGGVATSIAPRPAVPSWEWICEHGRMPDGTPFDGSRIPHGRGPCEAWDDPDVRELILMWGTRLGKTTIGIQLIGKCAATAPRPGLFATSTEDVAQRIVSTKIHPALDANAKTAALLPPPRRRTIKEVRLSSASWHVAYSGSTSQLADLSAFYGWFNELDKWSFDERMGGEAGEGDSVDQALERFKEFKNYKIGMECSPSTKSKSRIARKLRESDNRRFWVPCPRCGEFQVLQLGKRGQPGGIRFEKQVSGKAGTALARETAYYECRHCEGRIRDDDRFDSFQRGVWAPEGCKVDVEGRLTGSPAREKRIAGFQLSSLYSLQMTWGDIAAKFVSASSSPQSLRMFVNGWLAETWEPHPAKASPAAVGERLRVDVPEGVIPKWATHIFCGVDQQEEDLPWLILAMGPPEREHVVADGSAKNYSQLVREVLSRRFEHEDGGAPLPPALTFIDSGYRTKQTYRLCRRMRKEGRLVYPCKGANTDCAGEAYQRRVIGVGETKRSRSKRSAIRTGRGLVLVRVNPWYYEPITHAQLYDREFGPGADGGLTLNAEAGRRKGFMEDLCNGVLDTDTGSRPQGVWKKRRPKRPNDKRDCKKYARCAADFYFSSSKRKIDDRQRSVDKPRHRARTQAAVTMPDGSPIQPTQ